jgi:DNA polymerase I-like protein with 3'-5' exonuclease and polymerase domains
VRKVLFKTLRAPMLNPTPTGLAGTSNATLESLRTGDVPGQDKTKGTRVARFSETLLNWRVTTKVDGTYLLPVVIHADGRSHFNTKPFGVLTGRPAGRQLSYPRWSSNPVERAREIFTAGPGMILVYFDLAQAEARFAANLSNDAAFIAAVADDVHSRNALILFGADERIKDRLTRDPKGKYCPRHAEGGSSAAACDCGKPYRDVTKNVGFAIIYQAGVKKVFAFLRSQGFPVELDAVEYMFMAMKDAYPDYDRYVQENMQFVREHGYLRTAVVGRIMHFGFHPEPAQIANVPIQSGIADVMDTRLLDEMGPRMRGTGARQILHHYDSATFEVPKKQVEWIEYESKGVKKRKPGGKVIEVIESVWAQPVKVKKSIVCRADREFMLPAEIKVGQRWSDF